VWVVSKCVVIQFILNLLASHAIFISNFGGLMLAIKLPKDTELRLSALATKLGITKPFMPAMRSYNSCIKERIRKIKFSNSQTNSSVLKI
jgi:hypothetical protein